MKKHEREAFRQPLLKLARQFKGDIDALDDEAFRKTEGKAAGNLSNMPVEDLAELGSANCSEGATLGLFENASARLAEIDAALKRIDKGTFGRCEECGQEIPSRRLQTAPFAAQCIECARKSQQGQAAPPGNL